MSVLKDSIIANVNESLKVGGHFSPEDFEINTPNNSLQLLEITFKPLQEYSFKLRYAQELIEFQDKGGVASFHPVPKEYRQIAKTTEAPGDYKTIEEHSYGNIENALNRIYKWVDNIHEDFIAKKEQSQQTQQNEDNFFEEFYKKTEDKVTDPDSYFDEKEVKHIEDKLKTLQERIEQLESQINLSDIKVNEAKTAVDKSKEELQLYPKGVWYKTSIPNLAKKLQALLETPEGKVIFTEFIKRLMS